MTRRGDLSLSYSISRKVPDQEAVLILPEQQLVSACPFLYRLHEFPHCMKAIIPAEI